MRSIVAAIMFAAFAAPALAGPIEAVTDESYETAVLGASHKTPIAVFYWADWCGPCKTMRPALEAAADALAGRITVMSLNIDEAPTTTYANGISNVPTIIVYDGVVAKPERLIGLATEDKLIEYLESHAR